MAVFKKYDVVSFNVHAQITPAMAQGGLTDTSYGVVVEEDNGQGDVMVAFPQPSLFKCLVPVSNLKHNFCLREGTLVREGTPRYPGRLGVVTKQLPLISIREVYFEGTSDPEWVQADDLSEGPLRIGDRISAYQGRYTFDIDRFEAFGGRLWALDDCGRTIDINHVTKVQPQVVPETLPPVALQPCPACGHTFHKGREISFFGLDKGPCPTCNGLGVV